jgi:hypothetical protein
VAGLDLKNFSRDCIPQKILDGILDQSSSEPDPGTSESRGWHPGFFEQGIGGWQGEPLERPPQLPDEVGEELIKYP